jgi:NUMOD4 motif-containing protein
VEEWLKVDRFDRYSVSSEGQVRNDDTGRIMAIRRTKLGVYYVGLQGDNSIQKNRSLGSLVATAFVEGYSEDFNTPIHLDGDRSNNRASNLMWRPFWFAKRHQAQFRRPYPELEVPVVERKTGEVLPRMWEACLKYGLLESDLHLAIMNRTFVWPTYQFWEFQE